MKKLIPLLALIVVLLLPAGLAHSAADAGAAGAGAVDAGAASAGAASAASPNETSIYFDMVVDDARGRLYASNPSAGVVDVIALDTLQIIASIPVGGWACGLDLAPGGSELAVAVQNLGEIAFINLDTLAVSARVKPASPSEQLTQPYDVVYGQAGRLYSVGVGYLDVIHVFDTLTKTEVGQSTENMTQTPRLAVSPDKKTLYVGEEGIVPRMIHRFDVTTDLPVKLGQTPNGPADVRTLCTLADGRVVTSKGQVWTADLSAQLALLPVQGSEVECAPGDERIYISANQSIYAFDAATYAELWHFDFPAAVGVARVNGAGATIFISTAEGIKTLGTDYRARAFIPLLQRNRFGMHGRVLEDSQPVPGIVMYLRFFDGAAWSTKATAVSDEQGYFTFQDAPTLEPGQSYYLLYPNEENNMARLWMWQSVELTSYSTGALVDFGSFNIDGFGLQYPQNYTVVDLPYNFRWYTRNSYSADSFVFIMYGLENQEPFFVSELLGNTGSYLLTGLPPGFGLGVAYAWEVGVFDENGGFGVSYETRLAAFGSAPNGNSLLPENFNFSRETFNFSEKLKVLEQGLAREVEP